MRRLFSSFARGWPGAGLLVLRLTTGITLVAYAIAFVRGTPTSETVVLPGIAFGAGLLLIIGLWTPIAGTIVAFFEVWLIISQHGDLWTNVLLAGLGASLALIGPGHWSLDARLFGWKRIDLSTEKR
jgi:putative oxidoreductase